MALPDVSPLHDALLIVDMQNDFVRPDGSLAVPGAPEVIPVINDIHRRLAFRAVVLTKDWHPPSHCSFRTGGGGGPWPPHCVQDTPGADLHAALQTAAVTHIIHKGVSATAESYSAFADEAGTTTGLAALLRGLGVRRVWICGVAYEYCVYYTALDAVRAGFAAVVLLDATRAVDATVVPARMSELQREGVEHVRSDALASGPVAEDGCCCSNNDNDSNSNKNRNSSSSNDASSCAPGGVRTGETATATLSTSSPILSKGGV